MRIAPVLPLLALGLLMTCSRAPADRDDLRAAYGQGSPVTDRALLRGR
jgi:hypothetical protein